jgi:hypothetical protein
MRNLFEDVVIFSVGLMTGSLFLLCAILMFGVGDDTTLSSLCTMYGFSIGSDNWSHCIATLKGVR